MGFHSKLDNIFDKIKNQKFDLNDLKEVIHNLYDESWGKKGMKLKHKIGNIDIVIDKE